MACTGEINACIGEMNGGKLKGCACQMGLPIHLAGFEL